MKKKEFTVMKYKHSKEFWNEKYRNYKSRVRAIGGTALTKDNFKSAYDALAGEGNKQIMRDLVYGSKYSTKYATAVAEHRMLKSAGIEVKLKELKMMETSDFADRYQSELLAAYRDMKSKGITGKDAKLLISQQWFGSK
jgi:hypothetical protein